MIPRYRLAPLLEMKKRTRKKAESTLAKAIAQLEGEKKKLKRLEEEKREIVQHRKERRMELHQKVATGEAHVKEGQIRISFLRKLEEEEKKKEEEIVSQQQVIDACEIERKRARRNYIDAVRDQRVMEKHKEIWWKKVQAAISREEEREMDELGHVIHQMRGAVYGGKGSK